VLLMTPGLALFYGVSYEERTSSRSSCNVSWLLAFVGLQWVLSDTAWPSAGHGGVIGGLSYAALHNVTLAPNPPMGPPSPICFFMVFQMMFAVITPALTWARSPSD